MGNIARGMRVLDQGLSGPDMKCKSSVFKKYKIEYGHHEKPAKEIKQFDTAHSWLEGESMLEEWVSWAKG